MRPDIAESLVRAAALIRQGKLVAFPTETVYGLGANALDAAAVARIFLIKSRPSTSPLIVHVDSVEMAQNLARHWPGEAEALARLYWPGPLTFVLPKQPQIPDIVTAGLQTVGLRVPAHPLALELIRQSGVPIAAPSANRFTELSPTTAEHVRKSLGDSVDLILDGGPTDVGIESTVLSLAGERPELLRPGMISITEIESAIGKIETAPNSPADTHGSPHAAPGMHARHYRPVTPLFLSNNGDLPAEGRGVYIWLNERGKTPPVHAAQYIEMPRDARRYAAMLYVTLHRLDGEGFDWIAVETPPEAPEWAGIRDRLQRASGPT